jgi:hypothetical protein
MNLVGKIFTFLIFVMCIVFATFSLMVHAAHKNWYVVANELNAKLDKANKENYDQQQAYKLLSEQRKDDNDRNKKLIAELQFKNDALTKTNINVESEKNQAQDALRKFAADFKLVQQNLADLREEADSLRSQIKVAVDDRQKIYTNLVNTTTEKVNDDANITRLEQRLRDVVDKFQGIQQQLATAGIRPADMAKDPPADLSGIVTGVRQSDVEISVGYDDGVRAGNTFRVTRPSTNQYVGDILVKQVPYPNRAVGSAIKETMRDQIQKYDHVQANISNTKRRPASGSTR